MGFYKGTNLVTPIAKKHLFKAGNKTVLFTKRFTYYCGSKVALLL